MIQYARQNITENDIEAVVGALRSEYLTQGPIVPQFEKAIAQRVSASFAVATNSATSSLHVACLALGLGPGDLLWTVPNSFVASANCGLLCGADVDFVDIDSKSYCMDVVALESKLAKAETEGRLPKIIVVVHYSGRCADMETIAGLAKQYGVYVIEDAAHATGGSYLGSPIGSGQFSDITVFSFHPVKVMTTAEGGIGVTNNPELASRMARIRSHGVTRSPGDMLNKNPYPWEFEQLELGLNYRMTELQAALGLSQLERLDSFVARRRQIAQQYDELLEGLPLILPSLNPENESAWHLYPIVIDRGSSELSREQVYFSLLERGVKANVHFIPIHTQPYFKDMGFRAGDFPVSEWFYANELSLPMYFDLTDQEQLLVTNAMKEIF